MNATFGRHSGLFWFLFIWSLYLSPSNVCIGLPQDAYEKECQGTTHGDIITTNQLDDVQRYKDLKKMYKNCTLIRDNLEIVSFDLSNNVKYDFNFLSTIREVNGYVRISSNTVNQVRLTGLRVIRGWKTYSWRDDGTRFNCSLFVGSNAARAKESIFGLQKLKLTSLVEITNGDVCFTKNANLCLDDKIIDWKSITHNNPTAQVIFIPTAWKTVACNETCHKKCAIGGRRYCWAGRGDDMCQAERPCGGCRRTCSGIGCVCDPECIGGCTGSTASSCVACRNFLRGDECVGNCSALKYNPATSEWDQPPTTYILGTRCVPECPESLVIQDGACVTACASGYKENKTNNARKCVPCHEEACPKTCRGTDSKSRLSYTNLAKFNQCNIVDGDLKINAYGFEGITIGGDVIDLSDLDILKDVQEITGQVKVSTWYIEMPPQSFLKNLRIIGGNGPATDSLVIEDSLVTALNLKSLMQIKTGNVVIDNNPELCYVRTINWTRILTSTKTRQRVTLKKNGNSTTCKDQNCSDKCLDFGCWGPGDDNCAYSGE